MDDLSSLNWDAPALQPTSTPSTSKPPSTTAAPKTNPFASLTPATSGRSTPASLLQSTRSGNTTNNASQPALKIGGSKANTPANDSFASLLSGPGAAATKTATSGMSMQERQRQIAEDKARRGQALDSHFFGQGATGSSSSRAGTPGSISSKPATPVPQPQLATRPKMPGAPGEEQVDDILAAFSSHVQVDRSSHYPPPRSGVSSGRGTPASGLGAQQVHQAQQGRKSAATAAVANSLDFQDDDDPFGLSEFQAKQAARPAAAAAQVQAVPNEDDDILGMLGKPVDEVEALRKPSPKPREPSPPPPATAEDDDGPLDPAVAELVDMGFPPDKAALALAATDSGKDVRTAVGILLNQAHDEASQKARGNAGGRADSRDRPTRDAEPSRRRGEDPSLSRTRRDDSRPGSQTRSEAKEKDVAQYATEIGSSLFKSANSLWKQGQKKIQKTVAEFQQEGNGDPSQPKWMRDAQLEREAPQRQKAKQRPDVTNEAAMLDSGAGRPQPQTRPSGERVQKQNNRFEKGSRTSSPFTDGPANGPSRSASRLTRQDLEQESAETYISPARRRKPQAAPTPPPEPTPAPSKARSPLSSTPIASNNPFASMVSNKPSKSSTPSTPLPTRPRAPPRRIPPASASALAQSASHRAAGTDAFKRGDYGTAHAAYTSALSPLPTAHPLTIIVLCNRALTALKTGDPKAAVADADAALDTIGASRGEGEKIALGAGEVDKDMREFYGKALLRKAEALEHMERWHDAGAVWRLAVEAGAGGAVAIQGRNRCDKAVAPKTAPKPAARPAPKPKPTPKAASSALSDLTGRPALASTSSTEAVRKLRAANAAAERADDEKFALTDAVDAKLFAWKGTKADNLRALLGSLDKVLWEEAGWKKVGMAELVMPNRVKIVYMKAIGKVHPDKISQSATTEQRMLSAAIFSTLNEAWDKFKTENGL